MTPNNLCRDLIVYGSFAPGGPNHAIVAHLPGEWRSGKILGIMIDAPDGIGPGEGNQIPAWAISFRDCQAEMYTPDYKMNPDWDAQKRVLFDRWAELDAAMGPAYVRHQTRWWPQDAQPVVNDEMLVLNIYLPVAHYPYLANPQDAVRPGDEMDSVKLWHEVRTGAKRYDSSEFTYLLSDSHPSLFDDLFGALPEGPDFITRLNRMLRDSGILEKARAENAYLDHQQLSPPRPAECTVPSEALLWLVRADLGQRAEILRANDKHAEAEALTAVPVVLTEDELDFDITCDAGEAWETSSDLFNTSKRSDAHWYWCLDEACDGLVGRAPVANWLMLPWLNLPVDLEPIYQLWTVGGVYSIADGVCRVSRKSR